MQLPNTPSFQLTGRRALVTGAGRGIGLAAAAALAEAGAEVVLCARSGEEVEAVAAAIRQRGQQARAVALDVTDHEAVTALVAEHGPFQILVNNAGTNRPAPMTEMRSEDLDAVMNLNVRAAYLVCQAVVRSLVAAGLPGSIINISSQLGHVGSPGRSVYCATKHAVEGFSKALAWEVGAQGIRVNTICPTFIETPLTRPFLADPAFRDDVLSRIALGRLGQVEELMGPVVFLASDASALVTGSSLMVDGGWTAV